MTKRTRRKPPTNERAGDPTAIELIARGKSPTEIFHLARLLEDGINPLIYTVTGGTLDLSVVSPLGEAQERFAAQMFNGKLIGNQIIKVPNLTKWWWVQNATAGAFTLDIKTASGALSALIPQDSGWRLVHCDGNNNIFVSPAHIPKMDVGACEWIGPEQERALTEIFRLACVPADRISFEVSFGVSQAVERALFDQRIRNLKRRKEMRKPLKRIAQLSRELLKVLDELDDDVFQASRVERILVVGLLAVLLDVPLRYFAAFQPKNLVSNRPRGSSQNPIFRRLVLDLYFSIVERARGRLTLYFEGGEIRGTLPAVLKVLRPYLPGVIPVKLPYETLRDYRKSAREAQLRRSN